MKRVVCFGEALIDFLNTGVDSDGQLSLNKFTQFPGGAPANASVAVAKLGGVSMFVGQVGDDQFGRFLIDALRTYGVDTSYTLQHPTARTALAFVFLDDQGERSFSFHRQQTADVIFNKKQLSAEWFTDSPLFHFCSNTLTDNAIADVTQAAVTMARQEKALVSFDVNLRHSLWPGGNADIDLINALVFQSDLVKFSRDEIDFLSRGDHSPYLATCFNEGVKTVLVTDGGGDVFCHTRNGSIGVQPPVIDVIDTTAGGDAFIGAVLFGLSKQHAPFDALNDMTLLAPLVEFAIDCGAYTVAKQGAFLALPTFDDVKDKWKS